MEESLQVCPGCGAGFATDNTSVDNDFNALIVCREQYLQLTYFTLSLRHKEFIHQLAVDAYVAQHVGGKTKPITITFALVGLYLVNEKGFTGKRVQNVHIALARISKTWLSFDPPIDKNWITVADVVGTRDEKKDEKIYEWSKSVWNLWKKDRKTISDLLNRYLSIQ